jgi:hypothetical protein
MCISEALLEKCKSCMQETICSKLLIFFSPKCTRAIEISSNLSNFLKFANKYYFPVVLNNFHV